MTLEALQIREIKPKINTKDEYKSPELTMKLQVDMFLELNFAYAFINL